MMRLLAGALLAAALGGCSMFGDASKIKETCDEPQAYQAAQRGSPVTAPDGLDPLDAFKEMPIPEAESEPRPPGSRCITSPPAIRTQ